MTLPDLAIAAIGAAFIVFYFAGAFA